MYRYILRGSCSQFAPPNIFDDRHAARYVANARVAAGAREYEVSVALRHLVVARAAEGFAVVELALEQVRCSLNFVCASLCFFSFVCSCFSFFFLLLLFTPPRAAARGSGLRVRMAARCARAVRLVLFAAHLRPSNEPRVLRSFHRRLCGRQTLRSGHSLRNENSCILELGRASPCSQRSFPSPSPSPGTSSNRRALPPHRSGARRSPPLANARASRSR